MKGALLIFVACLAVALSGCEILLGPEVEFSASVELLTATLVSDSGVGSEWTCTATVSVNAGEKSVAIGSPATVSLTNWEGLALRCHAVEDDVLFDDCGSGSESVCGDDIYDGGIHEMTVTVVVDEFGGPSATATWEFAFRMTVL